MAHTPDPLNAATPTDATAQGYAATELRALKQHLIDKFATVTDSITVNSEAITAESEARVTAINDVTNNTSQAVQAVTGNLDQEIVDRSAADTALFTAVKELIYHVGSYFLTDVTGNPATLLDMDGTTWERVAEGRSLVSRNPANPELASTGAQIGSNEVTLNANNLPAHIHNNTLDDPGHNHSTSFNDRSMDIGSQDTDVLDDSQGTDFSVTSSTKTTGITITNVNNSTTNSAVDIRNEAVITNIWRRTA